eukprot:Em0001g1134a
MDQQNHSDFSIISFLKHFISITVKNALCDSNSTFKQILLQPDVYYFVTKISLPLSGPHLACTQLSSSMKMPPPESTLICWNWVEEGIENILSGLVSASRVNT